MWWADAIEFLPSAVVPQAKVRRSGSAEALVSHAATAAVDQKPSTSALLEAEVE